MDFDQVGRRGHCWLEERRGAGRRAGAEGEQAWESSGADREAGDQTVVCIRDGGQRASVGCAKPVGIVAT
jgi:hypothetical protein